MTLKVLSQYLIRKTTYSTMKNLQSLRRNLRTTHVPEESKIACKKKLQYTFNSV